MPNVQEQATLTSKGQITLPKLIRQALGVTTGGKVAFELRDGEIVVTRAEVEHEDPAIGAFLGLLEADIRDGRSIRALPEDLAQAMLANTGRAPAAPTTSMSPSRVKSRFDAAPWVGTAVP